jgi:catechol 2,3-dioxygenase-like lactoylglutathione lyase family enzyme
MVCLDGMIRRLAHLCLHTNDLERLIAFYRDGLGLPVKFRFTAADGSHFGAYISLGDTTFIEFFDQHGANFQWGDPTKPPAPIVAGNRYDHFALEVADLAATRATLLSRGVEVGEIRGGLDHSLQAWLKDPDGNRIELMQYTPQSAQLAPGADGVVKSKR